MSSSTRADTSRHHPLQRAPTAAAFAPVHSTPLPIFLDESAQVPWFKWRGSVLPSVLPYVVAFTVYTSIVVFFSEFTGLKITIPNVIVPILTIVLGLLMAFRTNLSYDRFWEGRKLWGQLISNIRSAARLLHSTLPSPTGDAAARLDYAQKVAAMKLLVGFAVSTKHHLRDEHGVGYDDFAGLLPLIPARKGMSTTQAYSDHRGATASAGGHGDVERTPLLRPDGSESDSCKHSSLYACGCANIPLQIAQNLTELIGGKLAKGTIPAVVASAVLGSITSMVDGLTNLERILTTRIPLAYALHLKHILFFYILLLPYQLMESLGWLTIPTVALATFTLCGIEQIGLEIENPFGYDANDLPQDVFCNVLHREVDALIEEPHVDYEGGWDYEGYLVKLPGLKGKGGVNVKSVY